MTPQRNEFMCYNHKYEGVQIPAGLNRLLVVLINGIPHGRQPNVLNLQVGVCIKQFHSIGVMGRYDEKHSSSDNNVQQEIYCVLSVGFINLSILASIILQSKPGVVTYQTRPVSVSGIPFFNPVYSECSHLISICLGRVGTSILASWGRLTSMYGKYTYAIPGLE